MMKGPMAADLRYRAFSLDGALLVRRLPLAAPRRRWFSRAVQPSWLAPKKGCACSIGADTAGASCVSTSPQGDAFPEHDHRRRGVPFSSDHAQAI